MKLLPASFPIAGNDLKSPETILECLRRSAVDTHVVHGVLQFFNEKTIGFFNRKMDSIWGDEQTLRVVGRAAVFIYVALRYLHYAYALPGKRNANANLNSAGCNNAEA